MSTTKQREPSPALPSYTWDPRLQGGRYVEVSTGRMVKRERIVGLLREVSDRAGDVLEATANLYVKGDISAIVFEEAVSITVRRAWTANAALAAGGWDQLSQNDRNRLSQGLRTELQRVTDFAGELDELSDAQIVARARSYDSQSYSQYYRIDRQRALASGEVSRLVWVALQDSRVDPICEELGAGSPYTLEEAVDLPYPGGVHPGCRCSSRLE